MFNKILKIRNESDLKKVKRYYILSAISLFIGLFVGLPLISNYIDNNNIGIIWGALVWAGPVFLNIAFTGAAVDLINEIKRNGLTEYVDQQLRYEESDRLHKEKCKQFHERNKK